MLFLGDFGALVGVRAAAVLLSEADIGVFAAMVLAAVVAGVRAAAPVVLLVVERVGGVALVFAPDTELVAVREAAMDLVAVGLDATLGDDF